MDEVDQEAERLDPGHLLRVTAEQRRQLCAMLARVTQAERDAALVREVMALLTQALPRCTECYWGVTGDKIAEGLPLCCAVCADLAAQHSIPTRREEMSKQAIIVTTEHRGLFFGYPVGPTDGETITLTSARMVVYWPAECRGALGLASHGALPGSRVSPAVDYLVLRGVTAHYPVSDEAAATFEAAPWS